jgi:hypothetical protein
MPKTGILDNIILENYGNYIEEHMDMFEDVSRMSDVITDPAEFEVFKERLLQGLEEQGIDTKVISNILDSQRKSILEEATSLMSSPEAIAYAVTSFPLIVNIYADPTIQKIVTMYPTDKPTMSISRLRWKSQIIDVDGNVKEYFFPTATQMIRPGFKELVIPQSANVFSILNISNNDYRLSTRNFRVTEVVVEVKDGDTTTEVTIPVVALADARGNFAYDNITIEGVTGGVYKLQGSIDYDSGSLTWSLVTINPGDKEVTGKTIKIKFRIFGNGNGRGVVKVFPRQDTIDIRADIEDSFEVSNIAEIIQDWKSLYNLDIIAQLKDYVKQQIKLNRDFEIADILEANIPFIQKINQYREVDLSQFVGDEFKAANTLDVFKNIIPAIVALIEQMKRTNNMEVQYLVCGIDTAAILKSMQDFVVNFRNMNGKAGFKTGPMADFARLEIVESYAVAPDLIHLLVTNPTLSQATLAMVMYKPLYLIHSTDNGIARMFIKSRNWIGIVRPEGHGVIRLKNYEKYLSMGVS